MTALELLESLNLLDEQECIEAKRASEVGKSLLETVCAFANEPGLGGGWQPKAAKAATLAKTAKSWRPRA